MQPNVNSFGNTAEPIAANAGLGLFGPSAAAALGGNVFSVPNDCAGDIVFQIAGLTGETVGVTISFDSTNYSAALKCYDVATGLIVAATLTNGTFKLPIRDLGTPQKIKFTKSSTVEVAAVAVAAPGAVVRV